MKIGIIILITVISTTLFATEKSNDFSSKSILYKEEKNLFTEVTNLYYDGKIEKAILKAEEILNKGEFSPSLGDLADLYIRLSVKIKRDPIPFLVKIVESKIDYLVTERVALAIADYYFKQGITRYYSALYFYSWIERNHNKKSLIIDDALWSSFLIYKKIKAYNHAIKYLKKIIDTEAYSLYVGSYNQVHLYDAYVEKAEIEYFKLKDIDRSINTLKRFLKSYSDNDRVDDAMFLLCKIGVKIKNKKYQRSCCSLVKKFPYSSLKDKATPICETLK